MVIEYCIMLDDQYQFNYCIELEWYYDLQVVVVVLCWMCLEYNCCSNCLFDCECYSYCLVVVDLYGVIEDFCNLLVFCKVGICVCMLECEYIKQVGLEEGLCVLIGLIMVSSVCLLLVLLRLMVMQYLLFVSNQEFVLWVVLLYLMCQYFNFCEGWYVDWELKGLVWLFQQL